MLEQFQAVYNFHWEYISGCCIRMIVLLEYFDHIFDNVAGIPKSRARAKCLPPPFLFPNMSGKDKSS